jgi:hypothetical protein
MSEVEEAQLLIPAGSLLSFTKKATVRLLGGLTTTLRLARLHTDRYDRSVRTDGVGDGRPSTLPN